MSVSSSYTGQRALQQQLQRKGILVNNKDDVNISITEYPLAPNLILDTTTTTTTGKASSQRTTSGISIFKVTKVRGLKRYLRLQYLHICMSYKKILTFFGSCLIFFDPVFPDLPWTQHWLMMTTMMMIIDGYDTTKTYWFYCGSSSISHIQSPQ